MLQLLVALLAASGALPILAEPDISHPIYSITAKSVSCTTSHAAMDFASGVVISHGNLLETEEFMASFNTDRADTCGESTHIITSERPRVVKLLVVNGARFYIYEFRPDTGPPSYSYTPIPLSWGTDLNV